jgi:hypothetical protein
MGSRSPLKFSGVSAVLTLFIITTWFWHSQHALIHDEKEGYDRSQVLQIENISEGLEDLPLHPPPPQIPIPQNSSRLDDVYNATLGVCHEVLYLDFALTRLVVSENIRPVYARPERQTRHVGSLGTYVRP